MSAQGEDGPALCLDCGVDISDLAKHSTDTLMGALLILDDAMEDVFMDDDFTGTYTDAILICLASKAAA